MWIPGPANGTSLFVRVVGEKGEGNILSGGLAN